MVRLGLRRESHRDLVAVCENIFARLGVSRSDRREDVAIHVTTGRERGEQRLVDLRNERAQPAHHDAVKLNALARGDAECVVAVLRREVVEHAPLLRGHHAAGNAPPDHHDVFLAGLAEVAVVLLIRAVKFQELPIVIGKMIRAAGDGGRDCTCQGGDCVLDDFVVTQFGRRFGCCHKSKQYFTNEHRLVEKSFGIPD